MNPLQKKDNSMEEVLRKIQLPSEILRSYHSFGVKDLYDWQMECMFNTGIWDGGHLIYCAPTSGGKTLVAELFLLKTAISEKKTVIFVLPYVSLVTEKEGYLKKLLTRYNRSRPPVERIRVRGFFGDHKGSRSNKENVLICTIEKANHIFNSLVARGRGHQLGCVVFDEVHSLGSAFNGHLLEILISKIKFMEYKSKQLPPVREHRWTLSDIQHIPLLDGDQRAAALKLLNAPTNTEGSAMPSTNRIQMIAMSATMGNVRQLADWLGGGIYCTSFRPIPLVERIKAGNEVLDSTGALLGCMPPLSKALALADPDHTAFLSQQALRAGQQVLVFCPSKFMCLQTCKLLVDVLACKATTSTTDHLVLLSHAIPPVDTSNSNAPPVAVADVAKRQQLLADRNALLASLLTESAGRLDSILKASIVHGIAYHHAGLSAGARSLIESGFRRGVLSILAATSTLAAGINLPAGRVLVRSLSIGRDFLNVMQYRQMCGRAGRMGQGTGVGESFLLVKATEKGRAVALSGQPMPHVLSQLHPRRDGGNALLKALLEAVGLGLCGTVRQAMQFVQHTLLYQQAASMKEVDQDRSDVTVHGPSKDIVSSSLSIIVFLVHCRMVDSNDSILFSTNLSEDHLQRFVDLCMHDDHGRPSCLEGTTYHSALCSPLKITKFGRAILQSNSDPDEAIVMYESLLRAQDGLHLETPLHQLYLVTPLDHMVQPDFRCLLGMYEASHGGKQPLLASIFDSIGIDFAALNRWCVSPPSRAAIDLCSNAARLHSLTATSMTPSDGSGGAYRQLSKEDWQMLCRCKRLWAAMALQGLVDGRPLSVLAKEFDVDATCIEALQKDALMMVSKVVRFCAEIGWSAMERLFADSKPWLLSTTSTAQSCATELRSLMGLPMMSVKMAKVLHQGGIADRDSFLNASSESLAQLLQLSIGFEMQELERVEIQLERSEQSDEGCHPASTTSAAMASSATQTSTTTACSSSVSVLPSSSSASLSRDEHLRLRLVALISSLQQAARQVDERRLDEVDAAACDAMAALHQHRRSQPSDHATTTMTAGCDDDDLAISSDDADTLSTAPDDDDIDSDKSDDSAVSTEGDEDAKDDHVLMDVSCSPEGDDRLLLGDTTGDMLDMATGGHRPRSLAGWALFGSASFVATNNASRQRMDRSPVAKVAKVRHESLHSNMTLHVTNGVDATKAKLIGDGAFSISETDWPSFSGSNIDPGVHKITISPMQPSRDIAADGVSDHDEATAMVPQSWALSDEELHALMEELESSGVLQQAYCDHASEVVQAWKDAEGVHAPVPTHDEQHYVYYPMLPPLDDATDHSRTTITMTSACSPTRSPQLDAALLDELIRSPTKTLAAAVLASAHYSAFKISVYSSGARRGDSKHIDGVVAHNSSGGAAGVNEGSGGDQQLGGMDSDGQEEEEEWIHDSLVTEEVVVRCDHTVLEIDENNSRDSNISCSDILKEGFEQSVTISRNDACAPHPEDRSFFCTPYSPYATPFTPSKVRTPGMYLYCPLWQSDRRGGGGSMSSSRTSDGFARLVNGDAMNEGGGSGRRVDRFGPQYPSDVVSPSSDSGSFGVRDVRLDAHCMLFLKQLRRSRCVSFELLFRPIPSAWLARYKHPDVGLMHHIDGKSSAAELIDSCASVCSWSPYISWFCSPLASVTCSVGDHFLESALTPDSALKRGMFRHPHHVLVGVAMSFGDQFGYYLPLPTPLPLIPNPFLKEDSCSVGARVGINSDSHSAIDNFPPSVREAIATYVGFGGILNKCPLLEAYFSQQDQHGCTITEALQKRSTSLARTTRNPLFLVSRRWCYSSRAALLMAWRKGACIEWKLFSDIMRNPDLTKVAMHVKSKMAVLRERDILLEGPLEDPSIAQLILSTSQWPQPLRPTGDAQDTTTASIKVPKIKAMMAHSASSPSSSSLELLVNGKKIACFRAVAVMRAMAAMEERLRQSGMMDLFRNIEMPLQRCAADAELAGIRVDPLFFGRLRHALTDRKEVIQNYCRCFCGVAFNIDSHVDVSKMKKTIAGRIRLGLKEEGVVVADGDIEGAVAASHPFMRLVSEHRSHSRTLPLCSSVLGHRHFDRVRAVYNTLGTETGRVIIITPPLQQVPKAVEYLHCDRLSLHGELNEASNLSTMQRMVSCFNAGQCKSNADGHNDVEWVHVASLNGGPHHHQHQEQRYRGGGGGGGSDRVHSAGQLVRILDLPISAPPHVQDDAEAIDHSHALVDLWRHAGYHYSDDEAACIRQVMVQFPDHHRNRRESHNRSNGDGEDGLAVRMYAYPADKVYRLRAGIQPNPHEVQLIQTALSHPVQWFLQTILAPKLSSSSSSSSISNAVINNPSTNAGGGGSPSDHVILNVRSGFQASEGFVLLAADYCQIELRILGHFSRDPDLLAAFHRQGFDVFRAIAASWLLGPPHARVDHGDDSHDPHDNDVTDEQRNQVKQICYALIYGAGPQLVADQAGISVERARAMMHDFLNRYPGIQKCLLSLKQCARKAGYVETLLGRRRYLPGLASNDRKLRSRAERQAVNTMCQGSAADLIKLAMINIHCRLADRSQVPLTFRRPRQHPGAGLYRLLDDARLVLQVHDELVFEVRMEHLHTVAAIVKDCMEGAVVLHVPLLVKLSTGSTWGNLSPLHLTSAPAPPARPPSLFQSVVHGCIRPVHVEASELPMKQSGSGPQVVRDLFGRD